MPATRHGTEDEPDYAAGATDRRLPSDAPKTKRGPNRTSCAECRRLKLKCDGSVPCQQCMKRGYQATCPDGTQTTGEGHRRFWKTTYELRAKLREFTERIQQLEDALRDAYARLSHDPHPLLSHDLLKLKDAYSNPSRSEGLPTSATLSAERGEHKAEAGITDRFGTLSISESGGSKHFGHGANSWWFLHNEEDVSEEGTADEAPLAALLPVEILAQTGSFPLALVSPPYSQVSGDHLQMLLAFIPPEEDAVRFRDAAFPHAFFIWRPIPLDQYQTLIHSFIYTDGPPDMNSVHAAPRLAVFFALLAIGALFIEDLPAYSPQAEVFNQLSRAALMSSRLVEEPTVESIQALFLLTAYMTMKHAATGDTSNVRWAISGLLMKVSMTMGLHCDPSRFGLTGEEARRRRMLWAELLVYDLGQSIVFGRPPAITQSYYDVQPCNDETQTADYYTWKYTNASGRLSSLHLQAHAATPPSYATVLHLTRMIESTPPWNPPQEPYAQEPVEPILQRHFARATQQEMILYLNRPFFAKAIQQCRDNPLKSEYGASVIVAYRSAYQIISLVQDVYARARHPVSRIWYLWSHMFSAAVVLASLILRCPQISFAGEAMMKLQVGCDLFAQVYVGFSAQNVYDKMIIARDKARAALYDHIAGRPQQGAQPEGTQGESDDVLSHLYAQTRTIARGGSAPSSGNGSAGSPSEPRSPPLSPAHATHIVPLPLPVELSQDYHPRVIQYLQTLSPAVNVGGAPQSDAQLATSGLQYGHQQLRSHTLPSNQERKAPHYSTMTTRPDPAVSSCSIYGSTFAAGTPVGHPTQYSNSFPGPLPSAVEHGHPSTTFSYPPPLSYPTAPSSGTCPIQPQHTPAASTEDAGVPFAAIGQQGYEYWPAYAASYQPTPDPQPHDYRSPTGSTEWNQLMSQMYHQ